MSFSFLSSFLLLLQSYASQATSVFHYTVPNSNSHPSILFSLIIICYSFAFSSLHNAWSYFYLPFYILLLSRFLSFSPLYFSFIASRLSISMRCVLYLAPISSHFAPECYYTCYSYPLFASRIAFVIKNKFWKIKGWIKDGMSKIYSLHGHT